MKNALLALMSLMVLWAGSAQAQTVSLKEFDHLDPKNIVPDRPLKQALTYFKMNKSKFPNKNYIVIIDYTRSSSQDRMFVINMKTGATEGLYTSHGRGSEKAPRSKFPSGRAIKFSNVDASKASSLGFFRTAEVYYGKHGRSLRLDGLSPTNSNARDRLIVIHAAPYVHENSGQVSGRSEGCPAVDEAVRDSLINRIKEGAMIYSWYGN